MMNKSKWKEYVKWLSVVLITAYIAFSLSAFTYHSKSQICSACKVCIVDSATLRFVSKTEVLRFLEESGHSPLGVRAEFIDESKIESVLESKSRIKRAECYLTPSGTMCIDIAQREPIFRVMSSTGNYYVDSDGQIMRVAENFAAYVPIVTGILSEKYAQEELYDFLKFVHEDKFWNAFIEQIDVNAKKEVTLVPRVGNQLIRMGTLNEYDTKLKKLFSVYKNGFNHLGWNCYKEINLMYDGQVVCTKR
jgi:cell division protein FtsQ